MSDILQTSKTKLSLSLSSSKNQGFFTIKNKHSYITSINKFPQSFTQQRALPDRNSMTLPLRNARFYAALRTILTVFSKITHWTSITTWQSTKSGFICSILFYDRPKPSKFPTACIFQPFHHSRFHC